MGQQTGSVALPALLTPSEACAALRISRATLYRMIDRGDLEAVRLSPRYGATIRIPASELARLLAPAATEGEAHAS